MAVHAKIHVDLQKLRDRGTIERDTIRDVPKPVQDVLFQSRTFVKDRPPMMLTEITAKFPVSIFIWKIGTDNCFEAQ